MSAGKRRSEKLIKRSVTMRFMVIVKASRDSEAGVMPGTELLAAMGQFNEEMVKAGVMQAGEGLHPTANGARITYSGGQPALSRGPFNFNSDLVAGFWLIQTRSLDEAIGWMKRAPFDGGAEIEIRQVFAPEDFGEALTPELREREDRLRAEVGQK
jgi:glutathione S-transferase